MRNPNFSHLYVGYNFFYFATGVQREILTVEQHRVRHKFGHPESYFHERQTHSAKHESNEQSAVIHVKSNVDATAAIATNAIDGIAQQHVWYADYKHSTTEYRYE